MNKEFIISNVNVTDNYCWEWKWSLTSAGYGQLGREPWTSHKLSYTLRHGEPKQILRHKCHNRKCCNPYHLLEGSDKDNWLDSEKTHRLAQAKRRGTPAHNRKAIMFRGQEFESKLQASKVCKVSQLTVQKECIEL